MNKSETTVIDGVKYIREDSIQTNQPAEKLDGLEYCVIRTYSAGVHIGYVKSHERQEVVLVKGRRLWNWNNAYTLSNVAVDGCKSEKLTVAVPKITLTDVIEIIPCTEKARKIIQELPEWKN